MRSPLDEIVSEGVRGEPDVGVLASRDGGKIAVLTWHYHDDDLPGAEALVEILIDGAPDGLPETVHHYRVDEANANAFALWKALGSPAEPTPQERAALEEASRLEPVGDPVEIAAGDGGITVARSPSRGTGFRCTC